MLTARSRSLVIVAALGVGTIGALVTSIAEAIAAHPAPGPAAGQTRPTRSGTIEHWAAPPGGGSVSRQAVPPAGRRGQHSRRPRGTRREKRRNAVARARALRIAATRPAPLVTDARRRDRSKRGLAAPRLSHLMRLADQVRQAEARHYLRGARPPAAKDLAATQQPQERGYFSGPATVSEMLAQLGIVLSQQAAARAVGTTRAGTDWSNARGYPVPRVLNASQHRTSYVAVALPWSPTREQVAIYIADLVTDISRGSGVPMAGDAYEVPGGPHLVGHPPGLEIMHWFDIRGYAQSGAITDYEDSVHGAPSIAWSGSVPSYSSLLSTTIVYILGARGYVW
jgi:hypothetical protein